MSTDEDSNKLASTKDSKRSLAEQITLWVGIIGTLVTITLTIVNARTSSELQEKQAELQGLELELKGRAEQLEESKERVERYKWVLSLFDNLNDRDEKKKNFTVSMVRLALSKAEAEQLFAGLQTSPDKDLQAVGQSGITAIQNEPIARLVAQMNATTSEARKGAVATLVQDYASSPQAIALVLRMYEPENIDNLSPSGIINGLYYLSATEPAAWDHQQAEAGRQVAARVEARGGGNQTKAALDTFKALLQKLP